MLRLLLMTFAVGQAPAPAEGVEALRFDVEALRALPRVERAVDEAGKRVTYAGVPLARLLRPGQAAPPPMAELKPLSDAVILIRAKDGYQVAISAVAAAMDRDGERYLIALERDGKPLDDAIGPARLIVPGDPHRVRWIRQIESARLVRLDRLIKAP